ncbi:hypothetical protein B0H11DRAFT_1909218 [Mycena galericulata]|nr:hypothetical protein B0H11DRAFT_1909218 [Mycena galericulata]
MLKDENNDYASKLRSITTWKGESKGNAGKHRIFYGATWLAKRGIRSPIRLPIPKSGIPEIPEPLLQRAQKHLTPARTKNKYRAIQKKLSNMGRILLQSGSSSEKFRARIINSAQTEETRHRTRGSRASHQKKKLSKDSDTPSLAPTTRIDIPVIYPGNYCKDVVPADIPPSVLALFAQKRDLVHKDGPEAPGCAQLTKQNCQAFKMESMYTRRLTQAKDAGWPISIDFEELPPGISALSPSLSTLLFNSTVLSRSPVWNKFLDRIGFKVFAFSRSSNRFDNGHLGCGYFGPKGQNIIESTLQALSKNDDEDTMSNDLYATLSQLLDTPKPWDQYDETSNLIFPRKFSKLFNGYLPEKVDIVVAANPESSQPPRHRKPAVSLKPTAREKKSAKKIVEKPKNSKSPKRAGIYLPTYQEVDAKEGRSENPCATWIRY